MVERLVRNEEVRGSIPLGSTTRKPRQDGRFPPRGGRLPDEFFTNSSANSSSWPSGCGLFVLQLETETRRQSGFLAPLTRRARCRREVARISRDAAPLGGAGPEIRSQGARFWQSPRSGGSPWKKAQARQPIGHHAFRLPRLWLPTECHQWPRNRRAPCRMSTVAGTWRISPRRRPAGRSRLAERYVS